ncbi:Crp/Fnr family transcriptional regulator [Nannocystis punicea]|uniref:Crp/Fnr family transcriptional regulator n=1 Tax=Nannocystis punicea TaxID=2995304 RepID=A0ABY7H5H2_9BACT|nr:Crp/Fnr family transcriptional regulator [Nannocystis poenicansa]WAS94527.1 Crp/Fnr family transcriptional regulator [Nannocystis poenicansa]
MIDPILWYLRKQPLFEGLEARRLRQLAAVSACMEFPRGSTIYAPGDASDSAYAVIGGRVRRYQPTARGAITVGYHGARQCFGEECVLSDMPRETFAEAAMPCKLLAFPRSALAMLVVADARIRARLFDLVGARLRSAESRLVLRLRAPLVERTASALLELATRHPHRRGRLQIAPALSMAELADYVGSSRIAMYEAIEKLADAGVIIADGHAQIIDPDAAARFLHTGEESHELH